MTSLFRMPGSSGNGFGTGSSLRPPGPVTFPSSGNNEADPFNLAMWQGPFSAPLTGGQMDALQGFNRLFNGNPLLQTQDLRKVIDFGLSGGAIFAPGQGESLEQQVQPFKLPSIAQNNAQRGAQTGFAPDAPHGSDLSSVNSQINRFLNFQAPTSDMRGVNRAISASGAPSPNNMAQTIGQIKETLGQGPQTGNFQLPANMAQQVFQSAGQAGGPDMSRFNQAFSNIQNADTSLDTSGLQSLLSQVTGSGLSEPQRFDQSKMFQNAEHLFQSALDDQLAQVREEMSGLGLGAGASDRATGLGETIGDSLAQFRLGQQQIAQQSFENAENRGLQGLGIAASVLPIALQEALAPAELAMQRRGQDISALNPLLDSANLQNSSELQALQAQLGAGQLANQVAQGQTQAGLGARSQDIDLASLLASAEQGAFGQGMDASGRNLDIAQMRMQAEQIPFQQAMQEAQFQSGMLPFQMQAASQPFQEQMQIATQIENPAADRRLQANQQLANLEQLPFERFAMLGENAANRSMQALPMLFDLENRPFERFQQQFQMNEAARQVADQDAMRRMAEYARTQGGGFEQILQLLATMNPQQIGVGPSSFSQGAGALGGILEGIGSIIPF